MSYISVYVNIACIYCSIKVQQFNLTTKRSHEFENIYRKISYNCYIYRGDKICLPVSLSKCFVLYI